jgi:hypothetical protein
VDGLEDEQAGGMVLPPVPALAGAGLAPVAVELDGVVR